MESCFISFIWQLTIISPGVLEFKHRYFPDDTLFLNQSVYILCDKVMLRKFIVLLFSSIIVIFYRK